MRKGSEVLGKVIVTYDTGEQVGKVADLLFDLGRNQLLGVALSEEKDLSTLPGVPLGDVQALGPDAVIISSRTMIQPVNQYGESLRRLRHDLQRKPPTLFTTDGRDLGRLGDVYFDEHSGAIQGYEVTGGAFAAASSGKSFVPVSQQVKLGADVLFVPPETAALMNERKDASAVAAIVPEEIPESGEQKFHEAASLSSPAPRTVEETLKHRVRCTVSTDDGLIIAAQGQIVTDAVIEQARVHHVEEALKKAVGQTVAPHGAIESGLSFLNRTRERVREETSHVVASSEKAWGQVKGAVTQFVHRGRKQREPQDSLTREAAPPITPERTETGTDTSSDRHP